MPKLSSQVNLYILEFKYALEILSQYIFPTNHIEY